MTLLRSSPADHPYGVACDGPSCKKQIRAVSTEFGGWGLVRLNFVDPENLRRILEQDRHFCPGCAPLMLVAMDAVLAGRTPVLSNAQVDYLNAVGSWLRTSAAELEEHLRNLQVLLIGVQHRFRNQRRNEWLPPLERSVANAHEVAVRIKARHDSLVPRIPE